MIGLIGDIFTKAPDRGDYLIMLARPSILEKKALDYAQRARHLLHALAFLVVAGHRPGGSGRRCDGRQSRLASAQIYSIGAFSYCPKITIM